MIASAFRVHVLRSLLTIITPAATRGDVVSDSSNGLKKIEHTLPEGSEAGVEEITVLVTGNGLIVTAYPSGSKALRADEVPKQ